MSLKMDRGVNFSKEAKWTKLYEKIFNITNIRENTNQNFLEILPNTCQDDCYKKINDKCQGMTILQPLYTLSENAKWCDNYGKQYSSS